MTENTTQPEVDITPRQITMTRESQGVYIAKNAAGVELRFGPMADDAFGPVELLMAALAGCSGVDVDIMTSRRAEPTSFDVTVDADYRKDASGNKLENLRVSFDLQFPEGDDGDAARKRVNSALRTAHEKTCTVSRTIEQGADVTMINVNDE